MSETSKPLFEMGQLVATPAALEALSQNDIHQALLRHSQGDWGLVDKADWKENDYSVNKPLRILSAYESENGTRFWVITDAARESTCVMLPSCY